MAWLKKPSATPTPVKHRSAPNILVVPVVSEKSSRLQPLGQYTFDVAPSTSKVEVKKFIEATCGVRVKGVNSVRLPRKSVKRGRVSGQTAVRHHMIVRLGPGQAIDLSKLG